MMNSIMSRRRGGGGGVVMLASLALCVIVISSLVGDNVVLADDFKKDVEKFSCGADDCYKVLGVKRNADQATIKRVYREQGVKYHPDKSTLPPKEAEVMFAKLAHAYEVLGDEAKRRRYDMLISDPFFFKKMKWSLEGGKGRKVRTNWFAVVFFILGSITIVEYFVKKANYEQAVTDYKKRMAKKLKSDAAKAPGSPRAKKGGKKAADIEVTVKPGQFIQDARGNIVKPVDLSKLFVVELAAIPYMLYGDVKWFVEWTLKYTIQKQAYDEEAKIYLTRKALRLEADQWAVLEEEEKETYLKKELWKAENLKAFKNE